MRRAARQSARVELSEHVIDAVDETRRWTPRALETGKWAELGARSERHGVQQVTSHEIQK